MGGVITKETSLKENALLQKLAGKTVVTDNDPFWNSLFSFTIKVDNNDRETFSNLESDLQDVFESLMHNTEDTGNFASFIRVFLRRSTELQVSEQCENKIFLWQTANALLVLRYICKFLTERMTEKQFVKVFSKENTSDSNHESSSDESSEGEGEPEVAQFSSTAEEFTFNLSTILTQLPVNDLTQGIHVEAIRCLLTILSSQLYNEEIVNTSIVFRYFIDGACSKQASALTRTFLYNYLHHNSEYQITAKKQPESIVLGIASSMWSMVQMAAGIDSAEQDQVAPITLGSLSILLLLNLACHHPLDCVNPFKETMASFQNSQEVSTLPTQVESFKLDFNILYERLCATAKQEPPLLLLYILLHGNSGYRNYVLSRINLENLVLPVLEVLHEGVTLTNNSHHVYLALIVMLILSEDDFFCKIIHETTVSNIGWLDSELSIRDISLGGLAALVFVRAIQKNAIKTRDRYLHTNCLAALANMSSCFKNLAPIVAQRIIHLLEMLTKRHAKMVEHMRLSSQNDLEEGQSINFHEDITALEEGVRTMLEIINSALCEGLRHNPHLVYTLLYHRDLFDSYKQHPMFQDLLPNIGAVISHFSSKVVHVKAGDGAAMMEIIQKEVVSWPTDRLAKFPELKFRYVEDENTVDFFVPYVWRLSVQHADIDFDTWRIKIFNGYSLVKRNDESDV